MSQKQQTILRSGRFNATETRLLISKYQLYCGDMDRILKDKDILALKRDIKSIRNKIGHLRSKASKQSRASKVRSTMAGEEMIENINSVSQSKTTSKGYPTRR
jgi:hypothetical protein